ncbi:rhomboid family intramembrane serine protease [Umezawaea tangerina]|uniref:Rhomboid family protein n=1 Tax=Umezawaea tangerina TaxID=84725 RepID=A0A2T0T486_9PSEU|nr:rhomboid family intramembrane serine protease [Umezawaea tangerina]PRY40443.1 rhomboid family protein [Umezawaea tangerina]
MDTTRRTPILTAIACAVASAAAVAQYAVPGMIPALERGPDWWRLVTPLLVQTLGWYQVVTNLVTLALVGAAAERATGRWRWVVLFAAGTAGGQIAAYSWHEPGGGDSIAICGLAGGLVVWLLAGTATPWASWVVVGYVAMLTGWGLSGIRAAAAAALVAVVVLVVVRDKRFVLAGAVVCALVLAAASDLHGVSLVAGMLAGAGLVLTRPRRHRGAQVTPVTGLSTPDTTAPQLVDAPGIKDPL